MIPEAPSEAYSRKQARRVLGISETQLRSWEKQELIPVLEQFAFSDLIAIRTLQRLRENGVHPKQIRRAVTALREKLHGIENPLKELKILSEGRKVTVLLEGQRMEPVSGQLLFDFDQTELKRLVSFPQEKASASHGRVAAVQEREAEEWFQKGLDLEQCGAPVREIIEAYERAIELDPRSAGALVNLGTIKYHLRAWGEAENCYKRALEVDAEYALAHFNLGNLYDERGQRELALAHYHEAIRLNPGYADAHYNLALLHQSHGEIMNAVRHWKMYLKLDGASAWASIARRELDKIRQASVIQGANSGAKATSLESVS